ncbi:MAG: glycosyltransferase, partial [bacterium]|nr:glycosyltransferase [bacterium]
MNPILNVIIPVVNCREYQHDELKQGVESILTQQIEGNVQILILHRNNDAGIQKLLNELAENRPGIIQLAEIPIDMSMPEMLKHGGSLATGKYILFFDYGNRWEENCLNCAIAQLERAGDNSSICLCNETYQRKTSAKSTFRYMYKKGDTAVDVRENPRYIAVSLNNVVMHAEAFNEFIRKYADSTEGMDEAYGWDLLLLTELIQNHPVIQISASAKFIYRNSERLSGLCSTGGSQYLADAQNLMSSLQSLSTEEMQVYIWNMK